MSSNLVTAAPEVGAKPTESGLKPGHKRINRVAVLGAGTMGARIAAHLANAGVPSYLLDIVPKEATSSKEAAQRNIIANAGLEGAKKSKPAAFFEPGSARLVTVGNFEDDLK